MSDEIKENISWMIQIDVKGKTKQAKKNEWKNCGFIIQLAKICIGQRRDIRLNENLLRKKIICINDVSNASHLVCAYYATIPHLFGAQRKKKNYRDKINENTFVSSTISSVILFLNKFSRSTIWWLGVTIGALLLKIKDI